MMAKRTPELHKDHRKRMKEKFLDNRPSVFSDHELLEILLYFAIPRVDTNETAHRLLVKFGNFHRIFDAPYNDLLDVEGIGPSAAFLIKLVAVCAQRYVVTRNGKNKMINTPEEAGSYLYPYFLNSPFEKLYALLMDKDYRVRKILLVDEGDNARVGFNARYIFEQAVHNRANAVILAHSHPEGFANPSKEDILATEFLFDYLLDHHIFLLDHLIFSREEVFYFSESDLPVGEKLPFHTVWKLSNQKAAK